MLFRVSSITGMSPWYSGAEREHQRAFAHLLGSGAVVIDIGANWGLHTLYLSRLVGVSGKVVAVEPYPPAFDELRWHLAANRCANVIALPLALSDGNGKALFFPGASACTGRLARGVAPSDQQSDAIAVDTQTLDHVVENLGLARLDLVKIDVEGAESAVLDGAQATIARLQPTLVIDLHTPEQDVLVARQLTERGYRLERLSDPPIQRTDVGWPDLAGVWGSLLAIPGHGEAP